VTDFEYAIKKDIRNNPIVREIDRERHREMWRTVLVGLFLVAVLLFLVWRRTALISHGYDLDTLQADIAATQEDNRKYRLEIEMLRAPARIEELAKRRFGMVEPPLEDHRVIERVVASPPPSRSVVARR
jgi:cell division protein FtsL